jgi:hypothetical protein
MFVTLVRQGVLIFLSSIVLYYILLLNKEYGSTNLLEEKVSDRLLRVHSEEVTAFWRKLTLPQEEKDAGYPGWQGKGYRWFRDPKIVCMEHYRRATSSDDVKAA